MAERGVFECLRCGESKPRDQFSTLNKSGAPRPYCKPCNADYVRFGNYGVTREYIDALLAFQGGVCAICGRGAASGAGGTHIDHDHTCCPGRRSCGACVRGLVCSKCNAYALAWYEALPPELRTFDLLNDYLSDPPAKRFRAERAVSR
ncbi:endonuclease domain-containing protein [Streptomyces sp. NPDC002851]